MYEKFFFLTERPFHITPDPKFLYLGRKHGEAIDLITYGIKERKGFMLLTGEVGTGKTTISRAILERLPKKTESALILNPVLSEGELLRTITADLGLRAGGESIKAHLDALNSFLLDIASRGGNAVVIIDEAQNLPLKTIEMIRLLSNLETEKEKLLQIILVGQPELKQRLKGAELRQLNQRIIVRHHLEPLDGAETSAYIRNRLGVAGGAGNVSFTDEALRLIHGKSAGIPRMINIICDRALTAAFIEEKRVIDASIASKAIGELEGEGYIHEKPSSMRGHYSAHYAPHIAFSAFLLAFIAGIIFGPTLFG